MKLMCWCLILYNSFALFQLLVQIDQESKKFKRLKKAQRDEEGHSDFPEEEDFDESGKRGRTAEEKLKHSLFGDDEGKYLSKLFSNQSSCLLSLLLRIR